MTMPDQSRQGTTHGESPSVSVVVCVHNGAQDLRNLFAALRRQTLARQRFEVIVVDDASTDATAAIAEAENGVRLISAEEHIGLPRARNVGMAKARAPYIALTDADTDPDARWLELGLQRLEDTGADMLAGGIVVPLGDRPTLASLLDASAHFDQENYVSRGFGAGANLWVRRDLVERIGGFNERLAAYGGDDNEFGQRATTNGARLVYAPEVRLSHPARDSVRALVKKRYMLGFGLAAHRRHNPGPLGRTPRLYLSRSSYRPRRVVNLQRLYGAGWRPRRMQVLRLEIAGWLLLHVPRVYGDLRGELSLRRSAGV